MSLKEQIQRDIGIFFSTDDFAEIHNISGVDIICIIDNEQLKENQIKTIGGLYEGNVLLYARESDLCDFDLKIESRLTLDGAQYRITNISPLSEIIEITLSQNMGY